MLKFLIFLVLLVGSSLFVTDAFSLEIEFQTKGDWIIEKMEWLTPGKLSLQEQFQIVIDESKHRNRISIGILSTSQSDIIFTEKIEALSSNPNILSFTFTNQFACAPTQIDRACIIIEVKREGLGDNINEIRNNAREITDKIVADGIMFFTAKYHSATMQPKTSLDGSKMFVVEVMYTVNKQPTELMFRAFAPMFLSSEVRDAGGFYNNAEKLSENYFSEISMTFIPLENNPLRTFHILLTCSNEIRELPNCDPEGNIDEQIARGNINPLDFIQVENLNRSKIFADEFLPLNSVIQVLIFSEEDLQVKSVNSNLIETLQNLGDVQESGWFFTSKSGKKIDGRYLFGSESSVSKNDLAFLIGAYSVDDIKIKEVKEVKEGGGCLIATAAFGSELAPQVQFLREIRDNTVLQTESGFTFMTGFNQFYYSFSPAIADYERENPTFKEAVKITLTPLLSSLTLLQYADIDSESEMLGYGISIILLNIGMYFVAPAILIMKVKKRI
jgi:hypothetical protein